jgi:hypothetical protein
MPQTSAPAGVTQRIDYASPGAAKARRRGLATGIASFVLVLFQFPWAFAWMLFCWDHLGLQPTRAENALALTVGVSPTIAGLLLATYSVAVGGARSLYGIAALCVVGIDLVAWLSFYRSW